MPKQTKRARKFVKTGGVKKRLEKGTITNKGKLRSNRKNKNKDVDDENNDKQQRAAKDKIMSLSEERLEKRRQDDFTSRENLADLDMDSFFATFSDKKEPSDDDEAMELEENASDDDEDSAKEDESVDDNDDDSSADDDKPDTKKSKSAKSPKSKPTKKAAKKDSDDDDSSNGSDSEDEDIEKAERRMKQEMGKLARSDPEFHEFLQENEQGLLEYGDDNDEDPEEAEDDDDDDDDDEKDDDDVDQKQQKKDRSSDKKKEAEDGTNKNLIILTAEVLETLEENAFELHTMKGLKKIVTAYKSACHMADGAHDDSDDAKKSSQGKKKYHIESSGIFDRLMVTCLNSVHEEIYYHLLGKGAATGKKPPQEDKKKKSKKDKKKNKKGAKNDDEEEEEEEGEEGERQPVDMSDDNKPLNPKLLEKAPRWKDMEPILFTFVKSTLHVLSEAKEPDLVTYILKALSKYLPYMTPFPRLGESMLKVMTSLWSAPIDASEDYQVVRLHSFLRIRQLALTQPFPLIEECLKKAYLAYAQRAKFANASSVTSTLPTLTFMGNCVVELFSLDYHSSYQHAFVYIRQLALLLRTATQKKTPESFSAVYCWQYLHCLKLWVAVLTEACQARDDNDPAAVASATEEQLLASLLFPLSQIIMGTVRLIPSTRYLPLRLHCVRLLQQLAAATEVFLPTTAILLEVFDLRELSLQPQKVKKNNAQPLVLTFRLKKENPLRTMEELEMCVSEVFLLLNREVEIYQYSAGFPEFAVRICQRLRKFSKENRNSRWRAYAKGCIDVCERFSKRAMEERAKLQDVAPKDVKQLEVLRPVNVPPMGARFKELLAKEQRLEASSRPVQKQAANATATTTKTKNGEEADKDGPARKKRKKSQGKGAATDSKVVAPKDDEGDLLEEDEIKEGVDWSDDEDE